MAPAGIMAANLNAALQPLLAEQHGAHVGQGGRAQAMPADERALLLDHDKHNKPLDVRHPFKAGPEEPDAPAEGDVLGSIAKEVLSPC